MFDQSRTKGSRIGLSERTGPQSPEYSFGAEIHANDVAVQSPQQILVGRFQPHPLTFGIRLITQSGQLYKPSTAA